MINLKIYDMKKILLCLSLFGVGLLSSCVDKNELVDADHKPSWLGASIYESLRNPNPDQLDGTFTTYLRLIDDLGYKETLSRTGSKTVFPANDEAFSRFFQNNSWGVTSYEQLTTAQKKYLLNNSMLDNALLIDMLSNVSNGGSVSNGMALKHQTNTSVIDSITHLFGPSQMPRNNAYWIPYYDSGIDLVEDNTRPMLVHFTNAQMVNNAISTSGSGSDFEIITGSPYTEGAAYVYNDPVIHADITCQNGYIHQLQNVLVAPGNLGQVLRKTPEASYFSHVLDYFAVPYFDLTTTNQYNDWAIANKQPMKDSIFQVRYLSAYSHQDNINGISSSSVTVDPQGHSIGGGRYLPWDPGWNQYYPSHANASGIDYSIADMGAMFVPENSAWEKYFLPGGDGAYLIDIYGDESNTKEHLVDNLDAMYNKNPEILTSFISNLMKTSFVSTVPSKFTSIINDASENMGMNMGKLRQNADGKYDIKIANNGVAYILNDMIVPDQYRAVLAPASSYPDMKIMNWLVSVSDAKASNRMLGVDFNKYLLSMSANYAFFIPEDKAFDFYYIDPASLGKQHPEALHIYYKEYNDATQPGQKPVKRTVPLVIDIHEYNPTTGAISSSPRQTDVSLTSKKTQLIDILNYHTVILNSGEVIDGSKHYYKTKHGGEIYVSGGHAGAKVGTDTQLRSGSGAAMSEVKVVYPEANGRAYRIDHVIQSPQKSVSRILQENARFSEFYEACAGFAATDLLTKAGISDKENEFKTTEQQQYLIFTNSIKSATGSTITGACVDENVKMFNTYNYTLYAPDNEAMEKAYKNGLPRWSDIQKELAGYESVEDVPEDVKRDARAKIEALHEFCRYHFQSGSVYADGDVSGQRRQSLLTNANGVADEYKEVSVNNGVLTIIDGAGQTHRINPKSAGILANQMARDIWLGNGEATIAPAKREAAQGIYTSSFCAVHELTSPLYLYNNKSGQPSWSPETVVKSVSAAKRRVRWHH